MYAQRELILSDFCVTARLSAAIFDEYATFQAFVGPVRQLPPQSSRMLLHLESLDAGDRYVAEGYEDGLCVACPFDPHSPISGMVMFWTLPSPPSGNEEIALWYVQLLHAIARGHLCKRPTLLAPVSSYDKRVRTVIALLEADLAVTPSLSILADAVCMSESSLCRKFKAETGYTITSYLNHLRIETSLRMLALDERSLLDISYSCGFSDQAYFSRVFRQVMGMSAQEYRKSLHAVCKR